MANGSTDLRDTIDIGPLVLAVIILLGIVLLIGSSTSTGAAGPLLVAQAAGSVDTSALDQQCTGNYDYTCQYPAMNESGTEQCGAGREVQSIQVKGYCVQFHKATADQVLTANGMWMSPEQAQAAPPTIGSQVSGGFITPQSPDTTGSINGLSAGEDTLPSSTALPQTEANYFPASTEFMPSETTAVPDTFGAPSSGALDTNTSAFSQDANMTELQDSNYNLTNESGVCNGCFAQGSLQSQSTLSSPGSASAPSTDYSNYSDFRASTNIEDDQANSALTNAYQAQTNSAGNPTTASPNDYNSFYNDFPTFQTDTMTTNSGDFYNGIPEYQLAPYEPASGNWFTNTLTDIKNAL